MLISGLSLGLVKFGGVSLGTPPVNTVAPSISGTIAVYSTITGNTGTWTGTPTLTRQWRISTDGTNFSNIPGATGTTYVIQESDYNKYIQLEVFATNNAGSIYAYSTTSTQIIGTAPVNTVLPAVSGNLRPDQVLTSSAGTWTSFPASSYAYQWLIADTVGGTYSVISGATQNTYTILTANVGKFLRCRVTATNGVGSPVVVQSAAIGPIQSNTVSPPSYTGVSGIPYASRASSTAVPMAALGTITNGELLIAHFFIGGSGTLPTPTPPAGWAPFDTPITMVDPNSFNGNSYLFYKFANNESGSNYTFTYSGTRSTTCVIYKIFGVDASTFTSAIFSKNSGTSGTTNTGTGITTLINNSQVWFFGNDWGDATANLTPPTGMTEVYDSPGNLLYGAYQDYAVVGATGNKTMTANVSNGNPRAAWMLSLTPSGAVLPDIAPSNVSIPQITGSPVVGQTISASSGTWNGRPTPSFTYQWQYSIDGSTNWTNISGATSSTYTIDVAYATRYLRVNVLASNTVQSNVSVFSAATSQVTTAATSDWPDATNTGAKGTLTPWTGSNIFTTNGQVIENRSFISGADQTIIVRANNVTFRNCYIQNLPNAQSTRNWWGVDQESGNNLRLEDCTIVGPGNGVESDSAVATNGTGATVLRCDISKFTNGVLANGSDSLIQDNWIHDMEGLANGHFDCIAVQGGQSNVNIQHNSIKCWDTAGVFIKTDYGAISNITVNNNRITNQSASKKASRPIYSINGNSNVGPPTGTVVTNNIIEKGAFSDGYYWDFGGTVTHYGNRDYDTNALIDNPAPVVTRTGTLSRIESNDTLASTSPGGTGGGSGNTFPSAATTGPTGPLTNFTGQKFSTANGEIIQNLNITGNIIIRHNNVTVRNCAINCTGYYWGGEPDSNQTGTIWENVRVYTTSGSGGTRGLGVIGGQIKNCDISGVEDGIRIAGANCLIQGNYVHDLSSGPGSHNDGLQGYGEISGDTRILNNTIMARDTSCIILQNENGGYTGTMIISGNQLGGPVGTIIYADAKKGSGFSWNLSSPLVVSNNLILNLSADRIDTEGGPNGEQGPSYIWTGNYDINGNILSG